MVRQGVFTNCSFSLAIIAGHQAVIKMSITFSFLTVSEMCASVASLMYTESIQNGDDHETELYLSHTSETREAAFGSGIELILSSTSMPVM